MSFSVVGSVNHLISEYRRFLLSTYRLADKKLRDQFENHIRQTDVLVKGPYVTLANDFARKHTLKQLCDEGVGHKDLVRLKWSFGDNQLYLHQEDTFRRVETLGRNAIVKTGTGSGKTESFLLALFSGILKLRADGVKGTKAILLYPMNALANDQLERLRKLIRDSGLGVTFAMYTGESESVAATLGEPVEGNEFIRREEIQKHQPDILLTNYKQLEFMLVRKEDRTLFSKSLSYLVLDEIHSYRGALATEIACLIRRLKARAGVGEGKLRCIGTSATVSKDAGGDQALAEFVSALFGESFSREDVIGETLMVKPPPSRTYTPPFVKLAPDEIQNFDHEDDAKLASLISKVTGQALLAKGSMPEKIRAALEGNELVATLERECREPRSLAELAGTLKTSFQAANGLTDHELRTLIEAYLLQGAVGTENDPPALRPKLHTFFHGVYDVGLCMNPACRTLVRDGSETCPKCQSAVRPAALCRTCGQDYVKVRFDEADPTKTYPNDEFISDENTGFITPQVHVEQGSDDDEEEGEENGSRKKQGKTKARQKLQPRYVCHQTGRVYTEMPEGKAAATVTVQQVMRGRGNTCPVCNSTYTKGDILTLLRSGAASSNSVLATHHLDKLPSKERKLLIFADKMLDRISVCQTRDIAVASGDRLHLKANRKLASGGRVTNGELVAVKSVRADGSIELADGRLLDASFREFLPGYAVTSYGSQGKTVDYVLFSDSTIKAATNAQQWYVTISRGRRGIRIFTPDKEQLRENVTRSGHRPLALELAGASAPRRVVHLWDRLHGYLLRFGRRAADRIVRLKKARLRHRNRQLKQKHEYQNTRMLGERPASTRRSHRIVP